MEFLEKIKQDIRPDKSIVMDVQKFVGEINQEIKNKKIKAICVPGGSVAKDTFIKGDFDVDLFVKFDFSFKDKNISDLLGKILDKYKPERIHGSRDYFQFEKDHLYYEVVPVLDIKDPEKAMNVTDMSPMHVNWVKKNLKKGQDDDIRLAKKFCKTIGAYGAESYIQGFSGHILDILIIHYGGFLNLLKASQKWKAPVIIDAERHYKSSQDILFSMNQSKIKGPMIIVDPLLKIRNAASALSYEKYAMFKKKAAEFLKKPAEKFFIEEEIGITYLRKKFRENLVIISLQAKEGKKDVVGSKILKAFKYMKSGLTCKGFELKNSGWDWNKKKRVLFWLVLKDMKLPEEIVVQGPPLDMKDHVKSFREKYKKTFEEKGKLKAKIKVEKREINENIETILKLPFFRDKISFVRIEA